MVILCVFLLSLGFFVAMCRGIYDNSVGFRRVVDFLQGLYALSAVVWLIIEWIKYGWAGAFGVLLVMGLPMVVCGFFWNLSGKTERNVTVVDAKDADK